MNQTDVIENIGAYIRYLRMQNGMTQEELANGICSVPYLSKLENNRLIPSEEIVNLLLKKLGIQIKEVYQLVQTLRQKLTEGNYAIKFKDRKSATQVFEEIKNYEQQIINFPQVLWDFYLFLLKYFLFIKEETTESKKIIQTIENLKNQLNNHQKISFYHLKGVYYCLNKNYEEGLIFLKKAQVYMEQTKEFNPELYYHLGLTYSYLNNIILAINYSSISLNYFNDSANYLRSLDCQIILGINYLRIEEDEKSIFYFNNVRNIIETFDIKDLKGMILHNFGYFYFKKKEYQNAIEYFLESLNHKNENNIDYCNTILYLVNAFKNLKEIDKANEWLKKGLDFAQIHEDKTIFIKLKILEYQLKNLNEDYIFFLEKTAIPYFKQKKDLPNLCECLEYLASLYFRERKYKLASINYKLLNKFQKQLNKRNI